MKFLRQNFKQVTSVAVLGGLLVLASPLHAEQLDDGRDNLAIPVHASTGIASAPLFDVDKPGLHEIATLSNSTDKLVLLAQAEEDINDPIEPVNRAIFTFNELVMDGLLRPVATTYNDVVPATGRISISNFLNNLSAPITLANDLLQFEFRRAGETFVRFFINSTVGIFGLADVAGETGLEDHDEDFGQTLAVWGVGEGMYLVLPIFGPSSPRDAVGKMLVDSYFDPFGAWVSNTERDAVGYTRMGVSGVEEYAGVVDELDQIRKTSIDYYAAIRSLYRQKRKAEISNGSELDLPPIPEIGYDIELDDPNQSVAGNVVN